MSESFPTLRLEEIRSDEYKERQAIAYQNDLARLHARIGEFVHVGCPACGADEPRFKFGKYACRFVECQACVTLYMSPRPSLEVMEDYYSNSENYAIWNKYIFPKSEVNRREKICRPNLERIIAECQLNNMTGPDLLEIGPGFGTFAALAKESHYFGKVTVVERTPEMANACRNKGIEVINASLEDIGSEYESSADIAVCFEVIEHIFNPVDFLLIVHRLLRPGGLFIFTCPNGQGFDTMMLGSASPAVDTEHVNLFNTRSIRILLERAGFNVTSVETPGHLDVELVRRGVLNGELCIDNQPFWHRLLIEDVDILSTPFQKFLVNNSLSGNMRIVAKKMD